MPLFILYTMRWNSLPWQKLPVLIIHRQLHRGERKYIYLREENILRGLPPFHKTLWYLRCLCDVQGKSKSIKWLTFNTFFVSYIIVYYLRTVWRNTNRITVIWWNRTIISCKPEVHKLLTPVLFINGIMTLLQERTTQLRTFRMRCIVTILLHQSSIISRFHYPQVLQRYC